MPRRLHMDKHSVIILEDNTDISNKIEAGLLLRNDLVLVAKSDDGYEGTVMLEKYKPDFLILDIILPSMDGFGVLNYISKMEKKPKVVVASALSHEYFVNKAIDLGADYYMVKPVDTEALLDRISELAGSKSHRRNSPQPAVARPLQGTKKCLEERIANIFIMVGIPANIKGYHFLREAIKMSVETPEIINSITKKLYPGIAHKFNTTASKVERAIRHAIEVAWNRGKIENINQIFGLKVYYGNEKPTNGEFIALLADKILLENYNTPL